MSSSCSSCKFWRERPKFNNHVVSSTKKTNGDCLRFPPQYVLLATPQGLGNAISFPATEEDQICGEFVEGESIASVTPNVEPPKPSLLK